MEAAKTRRRIRKRLEQSAKRVNWLFWNLKRVEGRIDSGHYAAHVVRGELEPERDRLRMEIDEECAWAERDAQAIAERYGEATGDHATARQLSELVREFTEEYMREKHALEYLDEFIEPEYD